jgi:transglutaminase-like putative cysteine protease
MQFLIQHLTQYHYSHPVILQPHWVRLQPRSDPAQTLQSFQMQVMPQPTQATPVLDAEGNIVTKVWFPEHPVSALSVSTQAGVLTHCDNPFNYLLETWATHLPLDYPTRLMDHLQPYLGRSHVSQPGLTTDLIQLAYDVQDEAQGHPGLFASHLNQRINQFCTYILRETGDPWPAGLTWAKRMGSCRDLSLVFIEVCRFVGLAARFVSGYQAGDRNNPESHLHAWAEVYLPGAGWRGYDPTLGIAVADSHVALMASAVAQQAAPIGGLFRSYNLNEPATSTLSYSLAIQISD